MGQLVKVEFLFNGVVDDTESDRGLLLGDKVLVARRGAGVCLYDALPSQLGEPGVVMVDLDNGSGDYLDCSQEMLIDIIYKVV